jgi:hypothetical protein
MWKPEQHSDDENLRWAWLRAVEWRHWPLFVSQPAVPVILYFYPWQWVIGAVVLATFTWWFMVAPRLTPATSIDISVYFVWLRFPISPLMAWWIWEKGDHWTAALALFWPFLGNGIVSWLLTIPRSARKISSRKSVKDASFVAAL